MGAAGESRRRTDAATARDRLASRRARPRRHRSSAASATSSSRRGCSRSAASSRSSAPAASARPASRTASPATLARRVRRRRAPGRARAGARPGRGRRRGRRRARRAATPEPRRSTTRSSSCSASQHVLLVLDNCEHVLDTTSELVELHAAVVPERAGAGHEPRAARHPGRGRVVGAAAAGAGAPRSTRSTTLGRGRRGAAVRRAGARRAARLRRSTRRTRAAVAEICIRLDGVPLALELAAARMRSMSPAQLAERLPERFRVLAGSRRADRSPAPHLRDLVQWSYELLTRTSSACSTGSRCSPGPFDLERAERVCAGDGIDERRRRRAARRARRQVDGGRRASGSRTSLPACSRRCASSGGSSSRRGPTSAAIRAAHAAVHVELAEQAARRARRSRRGAAGPRSSTPRSTTCAKRTRRRRRRRRRPRAPARGRRCASTRGGASATSCSRGPTRPVAMPGAAEHPLYPVVLGVVAYGRFVRGELEAAIEIGERAVAARRRASARARSASPSGRSATPTSTGDRPDEATRGWTHDRRRRPRSRRPSADRRARVLHAIGGGDVDSATAKAAPRSPQLSPTRRDRSAAARPRTRRPPTRSALSFETTDPARALRLLDRSVQARRAGRQPVDPRVRAHGEPLDPRPLRRGASALRGYRDVIDTWFRGGDWANQWLSLRYVFAILESLGHDEVAATLHGALDAAGVMPALPMGPGTTAERQPGRGPGSRSASGTSEFREAAERGRAMPRRGGRPLRPRRHHRRTPSPEPALTPSYRRSDVTPVRRRGLPRSGPHRGPGPALGRRRVPRAGR